MLTMAMTDAMPIMMPSMVNAVRILLRNSELKATLMRFPIFMTQSSF